MGFRGENLTRCMYAVAVEMQSVTLCRHTCTSCGSSDSVKEVEFISHRCPLVMQLHRAASLFNRSLSLDELIYLFKGASNPPPSPPTHH